MIHINNTCFSSGRINKRDDPGNDTPKHEPSIRFTNLGLSEVEIKQNREKYGSNVLTGKKSKSFFAHFISNFNDPIIKILLGALSLNILFSFRHSNWPETIGVAVAVLIATLVSTVSEYSSCRAAEKLSEDDNSKCFVRRDGELAEIPTSELVVGDVVTLCSGMKIPADGVIVEGDLLCSQAALTGEGKEIKKKAAADLSPFWNFIGSSKKMDAANESTVLRGSMVNSGNGEFLVLRTGDSTMYGEVAAGLRDESPESPLKKKLSVLAGEISFIGYIAAAMVAVSYLFNTFFIDSGMDIGLAVAKMRDLPYLFSELLSALTLAVSILVVAVPEGLPMMITVVLSSNMKKMLRHGVLVKRMVGIETAGSMSILFTDKTGTLTEGKMSLKNVLCVKGNYNTLLALKQNRELYNALYAASERIPLPGMKNSADIAISTFFSIENQSSSVTKRIPFNSERRFAAAYSDNVTYMRGAPEIILEHSTQHISENGTVMPLSASDLKLLKAKWSEAAAKGTRLIAAAYIAGDAIADLSNGYFPEMVFCGLLCLEDRLRNDAAKSVKEARAAGIKVVMMTGDNKLTAEAIAKECCILRDNEIVVTGDELLLMSDEDIIKILPKLSVIARALPSDKLRLVKLARAAGYISGMTGDGINDAPALKSADVGFSMGNGTDVTKEAGDIVITTNSFSSIIRAVLYGRTIFRSIRKFIVFQLTMNLCATAVSFIGPFIGIESPVTVIQMLWVNIIMDTLGALAFAGEPPREEYLGEKPFPTDVKILTREMLASVLVNGSFMVGLSIFFLLSPLCRNMFGSMGMAYFLTAFFAFFIFCGIALSFNSRTPALFCLSKISKNKPFILIMTFVAIIQLMLVYFGGEVFRCTPLYFEDILKTAAIASVIIPFGTIVKIPMKHRKRDL